jgi:polyvinyl alcohol dehydrogenase (cytochrome)
MRRRDLIAIIIGIAVLPLAAHAQQQTSPATTNISKCANNSDGSPQRFDGTQWNGWGVDINNSRFQPAAMAGLTPEQVPRLQLEWAFGFPDASAANAQPTIVGGLLFVGGGDHRVYALDAKSGCTRWTLATEAVVRTAITVGPIAGSDQFAAFFGDVHGSAYAVNATTGALIWKMKVDDHPAARIVGAPTPIFWRAICACLVIRGSNWISAHLPVLYLSRQRGGA